MTSTHRPTPYDVAFSGTPLDSEGFDHIEAESDARGPLNDPARFLMAQSVGRVLRDFLADSQATSVEAFGPLLYQAYQFRRFGRQVYSIDEPSLRAVLDDAPPIGRWEIVPPAPAGYLQLPRNLVWSRIEEDAQAEPVDGFFWMLAGQEDPATPPYTRLDVLVVLGMLPGRPGFSTIPVTAVFPAESQGHWGDIAGRPGGRDFENVLPGGEYQRLYTLVTEAEVLKLLSRVFRLVIERPDQFRVNANDG